MAKKGSAYHCPPKRLSIPADLPPLQNHAKIITQVLRATYQHRMRDANKR